MGSISIATMGKFVGPPTLTSASKYGGGGDGAVIVKPKKPIIRVKSVQHKEGKEKVAVTSIQEL